MIGFSFCGLGCGWVVGGNLGFSWSRWGWYNIVFCGFWMCFRVMLRCSFGLLFVGFVGFGVVVTGLFWFLFCVGVRWLGLLFGICWFCECVWLGWVLCWFFDGIDLNGLGWVGLGGGFGVWFVGLGLVFCCFGFCGWLFDFGLVCFAGSWVWFGVWWWVVGGICRCVVFVILQFLFGMLLQLFGLFCLVFCWFVGALYIVF